uniref:E3 ubiquitin-protein ligase MYLIP n=1 Tax=Phallusia mammillata TaxID=59560 RepID=A0A6F9DMI9_9ASCI|nr:E3 ubiquitin-protein ligase MYLIP [Phallusia mammillata]
MNRLVVKEVLSKMSLQLDLSNWQSGQILCLVSRPDSVVIEVEVDKNAIGQEILDKVCASIGTVEKDYFGLQYYSPKREPLWLNLRNRVIGKVSGQTPFRLRLRVKYFVETHYLLQESTRRIFYLQLKQDFMEGKLEVGAEILPTILALIAQAETGDVMSHDQSSDTLEMYTNLYPQEHCPLTVTDFNRIHQQHSLLKGVSKNSAISKFLSTVATLPTYGTDTYVMKQEILPSTGSGRGTNSPVMNRSQLVNVAFRIGPQGIEVTKEGDSESKRIPFQAVQLATHAGKTIDIHVYQDDGSIKTLVFRANSDSQSNALYRMITEMLAFYTWDTVHSSVIHQHSLDFKGHFLALFRPNVSDMDKQYIFDVQRTSREAHDNARRILYRRQLKMKTVAAEQAKFDSETPDNTVKNMNDSVEAEMLQERLQTISDALSCRICFDSEIECAFVPCGHQVCCKSCAERCQNCPICRKPVTKTLVVFLPITKELVNSGLISPEVESMPPMEEDSCQECLQTSIQTQTLATVEPV